MSSFITTMLLIPACAIGAGLFSFPIITGLSGFVPGAVAIILTWIFSTFSGLLIADLSCEFYHDKIHFFSLTEKLLSKPLQYLTLFSFLFICYGSLVGYLSGMMHSAHVLSYLPGILFILAIAYRIHSRKLYNHLTSIQLAFLAIFCIMSLIHSNVCFILYCICYYSTNDELCSLNNILFLPTIILYSGFSIMTMMFYNADNLSYVAHHCLTTSFPVLLTTFSYQLMIPSMANLLDGHKHQLRKAIIAGTSINCAVYLIWYIINIGANPIQNIYMAFTQSIPITSIITHSTALQLCGNIFTFITMFTSFISILISLKDYWNDAFQSRISMNIIVPIFIFLPVILICFTCSNIFLWVFASTGGYGDSIAFGLIPIYMSYTAITHYKHKRSYPIIFYIAAVCFFSITCYVQLSTDLSAFIKYFI